VWIVWQTTTAPPTKPVTPKPTNVSRKPVVPKTASVPKPHLFATLANVSSVKPTPTARPTTSVPATSVSTVPPMETALAATRRRRTTATPPTFVSPANVRLVVAKTPIAL
jgi:hypothetical protein